MVKDLRIDLLTVYILLLLDFDVRLILFNFESLVLFLGKFPIVDVILDYFFVLRSLFLQLRKRLIFVLRQLLVFLNQPIDGRSEPELQHFKLNVLRNNVLERQMQTATKPIKIRKNYESTYLMGYSLKLVLVLTSR